MSSTRHAPIAVGLTLVAVFSCAPRNTNGEPGAAQRSGATVVTGRQLVVRGGNLLDALEGRVSNMRVDRPRGRCPTITLRGQKTFLGSTDPNIYIDGTRVLDTCALDQLSVPSVERVEVYSGGISPPAGYTPAANGLILVFLTGPTARR